MLSGWARYLRLTAVAKTGLSPSVVVFALIAAVCAVTAFALFIFAAFIWLADRYTPLTAALVLALFFLLLTILAGIGLVLAQRSTIQHAKVELAARPQSALLDPNTLGILLQAGRVIGLRRILPLVAAGFLAAGFAREWLRDRPSENGDEGGESSEETGN